MRIDMDKEMTSTSRILVRFPRNLEGNMGKYTEVTIKQAKFKNNMSKETRSIL